MPGGRLPLDRGTEEGVDEKDRAGGRGAGGCGIAVREADAVDHRHEEHDIVDGEVGAHVACSEGPGQGGLEQGDDPASPAQSDSALARTTASTKAAEASVCSTRVRTSSAMVSGSRCVAAVASRASMFSVKIASASARRVPKCRYRTPCPTPASRAMALSGTPYPWAANCRRPAAMRAARFAGATAGPRLRGVSASGMLGP